MSDSRHALVLGPNLTGCGALPCRIQEYHVARDTGTNPGLSPVPRI